MASNRPVGGRSDNPDNPRIFLIKDVAPLPIKQVTLSGHKPGHDDQGLAKKGVSFL